MLSLAFSEKSLEVQRNVVCEEFKQRYLNQPYGDVWLKLRPMAYKQHPYQWATIGKSLDHIENANIKDVKAFFNRHYNPSNAIMVVGGDVKLEEVKGFLKNGLVLFLQVINCPDYCLKKTIRPTKEKRSFKRMCL